MFIPGSVLRGHAYRYLGIYLDTWIKSELTKYMAFALLTISSQPFFPFLLKFTLRKSEGTNIFDRKIRTFERDLKELNSD